MVEQKTVAKASEEYMRLLGYVADQPAGSMLAYEDIKRATGVVMNAVGKSKLRRAIIRSKREYSVVPNIGYKLADSDIAMGILTFRLCRINSTVKRADRAQRIIQKEFLDTLSEEERKGVLYIGAVFGAIRVAADKGKRLYGSTPKLITQGQAIPIVPG